MNENTESSRSWVTGLPVVVTVHADGTVEYEVDTAEASVAMQDAWYEGMNEDYPEEALLADMALVDKDHERRHRETHPE